MNHVPHILVVDDSAIVRKALTRQLEQFGARVSEASDGQQGVEAAQASHFDLIISDVEMPRLNGFGLCEQLKGLPETRGVPVVMLSSLDTDRDVERGFKAGAAAYVPKSDAQTHLIETIERVLEKSAFHHDRRVLVVDDSRTVRKLVRKALEESGFQVATAENGREALSRIAEQRPDLIISDLDMPELNGVELCRRLRADPELALIPFVIMSANGDRSMMRRLLYMGAAGYLVKPFNPEQIVITVERLLSDHFLILLKERERLDTEQRMMLASITSLITALEARDPYTRGHSETVAQLAVKMGQRMHIDAEDLERLDIAARLHDIGKIGVPDHILLKPDRLTDAEFAIIRQHPATGTSILSVIPSLKPILPVILHHHERFDGKGYPDGLKGSQIMLWARMTAVADTYHALTSDRPYRRGMGHEQAMKIIAAVRGTQLCPDCVDAFRESLPGNACRQSA
ncbi:MAG: response regulator [Deltaproteobacteria bacterium]|nr:response regulator [Deltaproteobacteria bacterium]